MAPTHRRTRRRWGPDKTKGRPPCPEKRRDGPDGSGLLPTTIIGDRATRDNMNKLPMAKRVAVVSALVEGNSLRSTCRLTGVAMNTVLRLLTELGAACVE